MRVSCQSQFYLITSSRVAKSNKLYLFIINCIECIIRTKIVFIPWLFLINICTLSKKTCIKIRRTRFPSKLPQTKTRVPSIFKLYPLPISAQISHLFFHHIIPHSIVPYTNYSYSAHRKISKTKQFHLQSRTSSRQNFKYPFRVFPRTSKELSRGANATTINIYSKLFERSSIPFRSISFCFSDGSLKEE